MLDPFWLLALLPVAAASGWFAGRRDAIHRARSGENFNLSSAYFKGLNFLLNEQPDKAIEVFIKVLEVDSETVEMHLTLGNLFRRRGEIERATRIHQNLIARPNLSKAQRLQALSELAQDYFKAGLLDRAENLFQELADVPTHAHQALSHLTQIYEQEKEWDNAIEVKKRLAKYTSRNVSPEIAHYHCELAAVDLRTDRSDGAREHIREALTKDPGCIRAAIQLGEVEYREGNYRRAIDTWREIAEQDARYLGEVIDKLVECYRRLDDNSGLQGFLDHAITEHGTPRILMARVDQIVEDQGTDAAVDFLTDWLRENPSLQGLKRLVELERAQGVDDAEEAQSLRLLVAGLAEREVEYQCRQCGFSGRAMHWQCPGCKGWQTYEPIVPQYTAQQPN